MNFTHSHNQHFEMDGYSRYNTQPRHSCTVTKYWVLQEYILQKPCCHYSKQLCVSSLDLLWLHIICSSILTGLTVRYRPVIPHSMCAIVLNIVVRNALIHSFIYDLLKNVTQHLGAFSREHKQYIYIYIYACIHFRALLINTHHNSRPAAYYTLTVLFWCSVAMGI